MKIAFHVLGHKTLGHLRIIEMMLKELRGHSCIVVTDNDLTRYMNIKTKQAVLQGNFPYFNSGGNLHSDISNLTDVANGLKPDLMIFLALFPAHDLPKINCRKWLVTWEYRDTEQSVFMEKAHYRLFDKIFFIDHWAPTFKKMPNMHFIGPIMPDVSRERDRKGILVTVGGGGFDSARTLENLSLNTAEEFTIVTGPFFHGKTYYKSISYVPDMVGLMQKSRLVISEAGYTACNELIATRTPCILVPGWRDNDDQERRARYLERYGAVVAKDFRDLTLEGGVAEVPVRLDGRKSIVNYINKHRL